MGVYQEPDVPVNAAPWPVINARPSFGAVFRNMTLGDYAFFVGMTAVGGAYGFAAGKPLRRQGFYYMGTLTAVVCATYSFRGSWLRLSGQRANPAECAAAGVPYVEPPLA